MKDLLRTPCLSKDVVRDRRMFAIRDSMFDRATVIYCRSPWEIGPGDMALYREEIVEAIVGQGRV